VFVRNWLLLADPAERVKAKIKLQLSVKGFATSFRHKDMS
jgi:hypothetical protein